MRIECKLYSTRVRSNTCIHLTMKYINLEIFCFGAAKSHLVFHGLLKTKHSQNSHAMLLHLNIYKNIFLLLTDVWVVTCPPIILLIFFFLFFLSKTTVATRSHKYISIPRCYLKKKKKKAHYFEVHSCCCFSVYYMFLLMLSISIKFRKNQQSKNIWSKAKQNKTNKKAQKIIFGFHVLEANIFVF